MPTLTIEWPTAASTPPLRTTHQLSQRCCYWEFYTTAFEMPRGVVVGKAKLTVELTAGDTPIELTTTEIIAPVAARSTESDAAR